ncbi:VOC family protein [Halomarina oriensis]|uniref:Fosmidomycin resistance protein n=1 Tax=Halomarina oriensis TaxID=671145 RepID=A0A6B0GLG8_9EURY|nr:VOC family protein [Halomarina oriensis]MWG35702.1 fosmidomycin resistance protein [Halomarina oriensis]
MLSLRWLALEAKYLDRMGEFYDAHLDLRTERTGDELRCSVGETTLVFRRPTGVPRGGVHTHYAFSTPFDRYDEWYERLSSRFDLEEHRFGEARSLYFYDPSGNCVEIGQVERESAGGSETTGGSGGASADALTGVFEVVLEVEDLDRAVAFYTDLGFEVVDEGANRRRVRLTAGPFDLELWEPHLGIADARGGVHVDLGVGVADPTATAERVRSLAVDVRPVEDGLRVRDPDGHYVTLVEE